MDTVLIVRWIVGTPLAILGLFILAMNSWMFVYGVILRHHVPSAIPLINLPLLVVAFAVLPIPYGIFVGLLLGCIDGALGSFVNSYRR